jgi:very-short-patch-repair endonuclease
MHKDYQQDGEPIAEADLYYEPKIAVFIDGPDHDKEHVKLDDERKRTKLKKLGYKVIVVHHLDTLNGVELLKTSLTN